MNPYGHLLEVQRLDLEISIVARTLGQLPEAAALADARAALERASGASQVAEARLHEEERAQNRLEQETSTLQEKIDREQAKLMSGSVVNPKELAGLQHEVQSLNGRKDELETALLEQMENADVARSEQERARRREAEAGETEALAREAHDRVTRELEGRRAALAGEREAAATHVDAALMARYEKFRQQFRGVAVGKLEGETCGACRVDLPSLELKRIQASDELDRCPECRRLLVTDRLLGA